MIPFLSSTYESPIKLTSPYVTIKLMGNAQAIQDTT